MIWVAGPDWEKFSMSEKWIFNDPELVKSASTLDELAAIT
jgi:hypothetical protein